MPSPFPGMDPYLEGYLWPDVHQGVAAKIRQQLTPRLRPHYVARLAISVVEDQSAEAEVGVLYPDVEIIRARPAVSPAASPGRGESSEFGVATITPPAPITLPFHVEVRLVSVQVRDVARNQLITAIEILSPVNKREPGLAKYRDKRSRLHRAGVHLLEIDLLRRGSRGWAHPRLPEVPYLVALTRGPADVTEVWPLHLQDPLPVIPVPLRAPDPDVPLDLGAALAAVYDEAAYDLSIDYSQPPPPPPLSSEEAAWVRSCLGHSLMAEPPERKG